MKTKLIDAILTVIKKVKVGLETRVDAVEARVQGLEDGRRQERGVSYGGTYQPGESYEPGVLVTRSGGLWLSLRATSRVPGTCDDWRLVCKEGQAR